MANVILLAGYGAAYTSESIANTTGADVIDTSPVAQFAVQVKAVTGSPTIQVQQTFDTSGTAGWANLGSAITASVGSVARFGPTGGPYGQIRFSVTGGGTAATLILVGFPLQWMG